MLLLYFILQLRSPLQPIQATPSARQKKKKKSCTPQETARGNI